jgi:hypothetical protein
MRTLIASFLGGMLAILGVRLLDGAWDGPSSALNSASEMLKRTESQLMRVAVQLESSMATQAKESARGETIQLRQIPAAPVQAAAPAPPPASSVTRVTAPSDARPTVGPIAPPPLLMPVAVRTPDPEPAQARTAAAVPKTPALRPAAPTPVPTTQAPDLLSSRSTPVAASKDALAQGAARGKATTPSNPTLERASEALKRLGKKLGGA